MSASTPPRASSWEWIQMALLAVNLVWTTLCLGGCLPSTLVVTGMLTTALVVVHLVERADLRALARRALPADALGPTRPTFHPAGWLMLPFLVYATANVLWVTSVRWLGWEDWFGWAQIIAVFWVVVNSIRSPGPRRALFATLLALGVIGVALACYQRFVAPDWIMLGGTQSAEFIGRASGPFGIPNSFAGLLLLLIPPCAGTAFRRDASPAQRVLFLWLAAVLTVGLLLTISRGGWLAFAIALTLWPLFSRRWRLRRRLLVALVVLIAVVAGGRTIYRSSPKARERIATMIRQSGELSRPEMWRAAWRIFVAHPALGSGAGSYNLAFEKHRPEHQQAEPKWAHNDYLNTLSDYGVVGFVLFFGAAGYIAWRSARPPRSVKTESSPAKTRAPTFGRLAAERKPMLDDGRLHTAFAVGLLAFAIQLFVDFHLKIPALGLTAATIAGLLVARGWPRTSRGGETHIRGGSRSTIRRATCAGLAVALASVGVAWNLPRLRAEAIRCPLRRELDRLARGEPSREHTLAVARRAHDGLTMAVRLDPRNAQAWADRAYASAIIGHFELEREKDLGREAEADARRALAASQGSFESWVRLGVALDMQRRWTEAGPAFSTALELAPVSAAAWFYQAYHFALNPVTIPLARSAVATCLRLDPSRREAEALRRHLASR